MGEKGYSQFLVFSFCLLYTFHTQHIPGACTLLALGKLFVILFFLMYNQMKSVS